MSQPKGFGQAVPPDGGGFGGQYERGGNSNGRKGYSGWWGAHHAVRVDSLGWRLYIVWWEQW